MRRAAVLLAALALGACSGQDVLGQVASSPGSIGTGEQRVMVAVVELSSGAIVTDPDITPVALLRDEIGSPIGEYEGEFVWTIPDEVGLYSFRFDIPGPATYQFTLDAGRGPASQLALALGGFNIGVELGQLAIVLVFVPLAWWLRHTAFYRWVVVVGGSLAIAVVASIWLVERISGA